MAKCREVPKGPHQNIRVFSEPMTKKDARKAEKYMKKYRKWNRNRQAWVAFWNGGAPYWVGPRPKKPGPPPSTPTIANTACRKASRIGEKKIYKALKEQLSKEFSCKGSCRYGRECKKRFSSSRGTGYSLDKLMTYCIFTVKGYCACSDDSKHKGIVEA